MRFQVFPDAASTTAVQVDWLLAFLSLVTLFFLGIIFVPMGVFLYRYRRGNPVDRTPLNISTWKIEVFWTTVPLVLTFVIFGWGAGLYVHMKTPPEDAQEIYVVGKQWMWRLQHPEGKREINALHVPVGRTVKLMITSEDVIHSFFIPVFRVKQDAVPGRYTMEWFKATKAGTYHLFCSEYCGTQHSGMIGWVTVMEPKDYQDWLNSGSPQETQIAAGERLFHQLGCSGCHAENSKVRAPSLVGLYGKPVPLEGGTIVTADERYLHDSIVMPAKQIVFGYENLMPSFEGQLNEEQLFQLVQYLKHLGREQPPEYRRQGEGAAQFIVPHEAP
ncbi:MAG: cytochrome c oxidase subunit II [Verrucomicrobia bacterium]|nr:cytochrome c oxidase subunit II [Verrucomicrobiota bacterium]MBV9658759.1 cytochrome c oxidase subunit II [Verrucomicrobiota bacterium]